MKSRYVGPTAVQGMHEAHRGSKRPRSIEQPGLGHQGRTPVQLSMAGHNGRLASLSTPKEPLRIPRPASKAVGEPEAKRQRPIFGPELPPGAAAAAAPQAPPKARQQQQSPQQAAAAADASRRHSSEPPAAAGKKCDKCDGPHPTDRCPHFKKAREDHKDAWVHYGNKRPRQLGEGGGRFVMRSGRPVRQPGDGSCLFHSLSFGLNRLSQGHVCARDLRRELAHFIAKNPRLEISGDTLEEWVHWDARSTVPAYTSRMAHSGWGGGIEMAACSLLKKVNVHVYECRRHGEFERISCFDCPTKPSKGTIHVLYKGGMHYDALVPGSG